MHTRVFNEPLLISRQSLIGVLASPANRREKGPGDSREESSMKWSRIAAVLCVAAFCLAFAGQAFATKYVALGDSYSSGVGTRTFYEGTCQRSVYAYPYLLHEAHPTWTFVNATCSGATTSSLLSSQVSSVTSTPTGSPTRSAATTPGSRT